jgi:putative FmdB family regulatory protein
MPVYEFICSTCGQHFEKTLPVGADQAGVRCPAGHPKARRVFSAPGVHFKGSGFYATDQRPASSPKKTSS